MQASDPGLEDMELRHLKYFVAVAEELHFRRAAERLHVAQPAVSEQVRKLEGELGVRLLERTPRSVALTNAGSAFLDEARLTLEQLEVAERAARGARDGELHRLRIGYVPAFLPASVPLALQRLASSMPQVESSMQQGDALELREAVRSQRLDAAIVSLPGRTADLRATALDEQRVVAVLPVGHRHAVVSQVRLAQLAPERIVVLPRRVDRALHDAIVTSLRNAGLAPTLVELPDGHVEQALLAVAAGTGMALLPESVAERYAAPALRFVPLEGDQPVFATVALTRSDGAHLPTTAFLHELMRADGTRRPLPRHADETTAA
jgi:DNA-binding transcriptional LysR family regulator